MLLYIQGVQLTPGHEIVIMAPLSCTGWVHIWGHFSARLTRNVEVPQQEFWLMQIWRAVNYTQQATANHHFDCTWWWERLYYSWIRHKTISSHSNASLCKEAEGSSISAVPVQTVSSPPSLQCLLMMPLDLVFHPITHMLPHMWNTSALYACVNIHALHSCM